MTGKTGKIDLEELSKIIDLMHEKGVTSLKMGGLEIVVTPLKPISRSIIESEEETIEEASDKDLFWSAE